METERRIEWNMRGLALFRWVVVVVVGAVFVGVGYSLFPELDPRPATTTLLTTGQLVLLGVGVVAGLIAWAMVATKAARRFGDAALELETVPVPLGRRLEGQIRAHATLAPDEALNLILQCWAKETSGGESGGGSRVRWGSEQLLTPADVEQKDGVLVVPVDLAVPNDKPPTGESRREEFWWTLSLSLEPRSGYKPEFQVPVLRTAESPPEPEREPEPAIGIVGVMQKVGEFVELANDGTLAAAAATWHQEPPMPRPPHARIDVRQRRGGGVDVELPKTKVGMVFAFWFLLTLPLWITLPTRSFAALDIIIDPPAIAYLLYLGLGFGIPFLMTALAASSLAWQKVRLRVGPDGVTVQRRLGRRTYPPGKFTTASARGNTNDGWSVGLEKSETAFLGGLQVASPRTESEARWLAAELRQALGGGAAG